MKNTIKKVTTLLLAVAMILSLAACGKKAEPADISVAVLKGPTAIGMAKLMSDNEAKTASNNYTFTVAGAADEITAKLISGEIQVAAIPSNLAATLYNKTNGKIQVCAINTLGVLYIVENSNAINSVADLKGKTIYSTGKGTTPEYTLRALLQNAGIDPDKDVTIEYKSEATEVAAMLKVTDKEVVAMLPQPYVTAVMTQNQAVRVALDVTKEWEAIFKDSTVVTGVLAVNAEWAKNNEKALASFLKEYKASTEYANAEVEKTAEILEHFDIFKAAIAKKAIPNCHVVYYDGKDLDKVTAYLKALFEQNPASIGGKMPEGDFFR